MLGRNDVIVKIAGYAQKEALEVRCSLDVMRSH